jgi:transposase-like protein
MSIKLTITCPSCSATNTYEFGGINSSSRGHNTSKPCRSCHKSMKIRIDSGSVTQVRS